MDNNVAIIDAAKLDAEMKTIRRALQQHEIFAQIWDKYFRKQNNFDDNLTLEENLAELNVIQAELLKARDDITSVPRT